MKKILRTAKIRRGRKPSPILESEEFFEPFISKLVNWLVNPDLLVCHSNNTLETHRWKPPFQVQRRLKQIDCKLTISADISVCF